MLPLLLCNYILDLRRMVLNEKFRTEWKFLNRNLKFVNWFDELLRRLKLKDKKR